MLSLGMRVHRPAAAAVRRRAKEACRRASAQTSTEPLEFTRTHLRLDSVDKSFATATASGTHDFRVCQELWTPEQGRIARKQFGEVFNFYLTHWDASQPRPWETFKEIVHATRHRAARLRAGSHNNKELYATDDYYAELVIAVVTPGLSERSRVDPIRDSVREGDGWQLGSNETNLLPLDRLMPIQFRGPLSDEERQPASDMVRAMLHLHSRGDAAIGKETWNAILMYYCFLHRTEQCDVAGELLMLLEQGSNNGVRFHPTILDMVMDILLARLTELKDLPATASAGYDEVVEQKQAVVNGAVNIVRTLAEGRSGSAAARKVAPVLAMRLWKVAGGGGLTTTLAGAVCRLDPASEAVQAAGLQLVIHIVRQFDSRLRREGRGGGGADVFWLLEHSRNVAGVQITGGTAKKLVAALDVIEQMWRPGSGWLRTLASASAEWRRPEGNEALHMLVLLLGTVRTAPKATEDRNGNARRVATAVRVALFAARGGLKLEWDVVSDLCGVLLHAGDAGHGPIISGDIEPAAARGEDEGSSIDESRPCLASWVELTIARDDLPLDRPDYWQPLVRMCSYYQLDSLADSLLAKAFAGRRRGRASTPGAVSFIMQHTGDLDLMVSAMEELLRTGQQAPPSSYLSAFRRLAAADQHERVRELFAKLEPALDSAVADYCCVVVAGSMCTAGGSGVGLAAELLGQSMDQWRRLGDSRERRMQLEPNIALFKKLSGRGLPSRIVDNLEAIYMFDRRGSREPWA